MMAWRKFLFPLTLGAILGTYGMWLFADVGSVATVAAVLLGIQIPLLVWDVVVTIRVGRMLRQTQKDMEVMAREWWHQNN